MIPYELFLSPPLSPVRVCEMYSSALHRWNMPRDTTPCTTHIGHRAPHMHEISSLLVLPLSLYACSYVYTIAKRKVLPLLPSRSRAPLPTPCLCPTAHSTQTLYRTALSLFGGAHAFTGAAPRDGCRWSAASWTTSTAASASASASAARSLGSAATIRPMTQRMSPSA